MQESSELAGMLEAAAPYINGYGLWAVWGALLLETFFLTGYIFPAMLVVIAAAYFSAEGLLAIEHVYLAALAGAVIGDNLSFAAGRLAGARFLRKRERLAGRIAAALKGGGLPLLLWYQYASLVRPVVPLAAGYARYPWGKFALLDSLGLAVWIAFLCTCGYLAGGMLAGHGGMLAWVMRGVALAATLGILVLAWLRVRRFERESRADEPAKQAGGNRSD